MYQRIKAAIGRFFFAQPVLKRGLLAGALYSPVFGIQFIAPGAPVCLGVVVGVGLVAVFLGIGAERAATEWDKTFSLPPIGAFAFWRWQPAERRRFIVTGGVLLLAVVVTFLTRGGTQ